MELFNLIYIEDLNNQAVAPVAPVGPILQLQLQHGLHALNLKSFIFIFYITPPIIIYDETKKK